MWLTKHSLGFSLITVERSGGMSKTPVAGGLMRYMGFIGWSRSVGSLMTVAMLLAPGYAGVDTYSHVQGAYSHGPGAFSHGSGVLSLDWGKCDQRDSMKYGFWPSRMNKKKCPGIEP